MKLTLYLQHGTDKIGMTITDIDHLMDILRFQIKEKNKELNGELHINDKKQSNTPAYTQFGVRK